MAEGSVGKVKGKNRITKQQDAEKFTKKIKKGDREGEMEITLFLTKIFWT